METRAGPTIEPHRHTKLAGPGNLAPYPVYHPFEVGHLAQQRYRLAACQVILFKPLDCVLPLCQFVDIQQRLAQPPSEQPAAHRRLRHIDNRKQRTGNRPGTGTFQ